MKADRAVIRVMQIDHRLPDNARRIHAIQMTAYTQEAALLGAVDFPPLGQSVADIAQSNECFLGACIDEELVGALSTCWDQEAPGINIASLVVSPAHQRRGVARTLVSAVVVQHAGSAFTVQTGAANAPALALYEEFGFTECRRWLAGDPPLELVRLRRPAFTR